MENGFFIVRQGEGEKATYALCHRYDTVPENYAVAGTNKNAGQIVEEQKLMAAFVSSRKTTVVATMTIEPQNADN